MRGNSSVVERHLAKVDVAGPTPVSRSKGRGDPGCRVAFFITERLPERPCEGRSKAAWCGLSSPERKAP